MCSYLHPLATAVYFEQNTVVAYDSKLTSWKIK